MNLNLCISVTFLDPLSHGWGDDEPEWPPSPMRLFQALLAGARIGCRGISWNESKADAFRWLGGRRPPLIIAPAARRATRSTFFVPNNDSDKKFERQDRLTSKLTWPYRLLGGDTVHFVWAMENGVTAHASAEVLCGEARNLLALGWGIDQVSGRGRVLTDAEVAALPGQSWRARDARRPGVRTWRVPTVGSLENLEQVHQSFLRRIKGKRYRPPLRLSQFDTVDYLSTGMLPPRSYAAFELPQGVAFRQESAARVAAMLRSLTCRQAKADTHEFPGGMETYVAGHVGQQDWTPPRFSYLPLPAIGHENSDGMIRRFLITEPFGGEREHAQWAQERLRNGTLRDEDGNDRGVLLELWRPSSKRMIGRYVDEAQTWCTVTPVVLPGFDDGKQAKAERIFLKAMMQASIPIDDIDAIALRKAPFWPGAYHPHHYFAPNYIRHLPRWHAWVRFRAPLPGPLAVGAGRHLGLGIFAAKESPV